MLLLVLFVLGLCLVAAICWAEAKENGMDPYLRVLGEVVNRRGGV